MMLRGTLYGGCLLVFVAFASGANDYIWNLSFFFRKCFQMVREGTVVTGGGNAILENWFLKSKSSKHYHRMLSDPTFPNSFKNHHIYFFIS